jgi:uncharacterized membrane protein YgdD (TMEM256/DUF423 family)
MKASAWIWIGAISGFVSVAMGAFGAHSLKQVLDEKALAVFHTGAQYEMYHALALIGVGLWAAQHPNASAQIPGWAFLIGTLLFSGSLYALALTGIRSLGVITPFGGVCFLIGWIAFAFTARGNP